MSYLVGPPVKLFFMLIVLWLLFSTPTFIYYLSLASVLIEKIILLYIIHFRLLCFNAV